MKIALIHTRLDVFVLKKLAKGIGLVEVQIG